MTKARTLGNFVSAGNPLADGTITASDVSGLGTAATTDSSAYATAAQGALADSALQSSAIGTTVQAYDADLTSFAGKTAPTGAVVGTSDTQTLSAKTIEAGTFTNGYTEEVNTANTSTAYTISLNDGSFQILTLTGSATITMPTATAGKSFILLLKQDGTGSRTVTWSTVKWAGGTAPTITSTASKQDIYSFFADGTNWYGTTVGQNYTP